jgi:ADP-ribose pyrophosphatase YjhB (NUDIX family)
MKNISITRGKKLTHRVAVNAFLISEDRFLLLKRAQPPLLWGPPGGHLNPNEDPINGLKREVLEETGLQIDVLGPVTTWFGKFHDSYLLSIDYLGTIQKGELRLSLEHETYKWLTISELQRYQKKYLNCAKGFKLSDFKLAWLSYLLKMKRLGEIDKTMIETF